MQYEVKIQSVPAQQLAVVRRRVKWSELGAQLIPLLDRVYAQVRAGKVIQTGQNVFVYRNGAKDGVTVEIGVEVSDRFEEVGDVVYSNTPSGVVASTLHVGLYSELGGAHETVIRWCKEHHHSQANVWWEVYGDWEEDPSKLQTEIFYLVQQSKESS